MRIDLIKLMFYVAVFFSSSAYCSIHYYTVIDQATVYGAEVIDKGIDGTCKKKKPHVGRIEYNDQTNSATMVVSMCYLYNNKVNYTDLIIKISCDADGLTYVTWENGMHAFKDDLRIRFVKPTDDSIAPPVYYPFVRPILPESLVGICSGETFFYHPEIIREEPEYPIRSNAIYQGTIVLKFQEGEIQEGEEIKCCFLLKRMIMGRFSALPATHSTTIDRAVGSKLTKHNFCKIIEGLSILINFQKSITFYKEILNAKNVVLSHQTPFFAAPSCADKPDNYNQTGMVESGLTIPCQQSCQLPHDSQVTSYYVPINNYNQTGMVESGLTIPCQQACQLPHDSQVTSYYVPINQSVNYNQTTYYNQHSLVESGLTIPWQQSRQLTRDSQVTSSCHMQINNYDQTTYYIPVTIQDYLFSRQLGR